METSNKAKIRFVSKKKEDSTPNSPDSNSVSGDHNNSEVNTSVDRDMEEIYNPLVSSTPNSNMAVEDKSEQDLNSLDSTPGSLKRSRRSAKIRADGEDEFELDNMSSDDDLESDDDSDYDDGTPGKPKQNPHNDDELEHEETDPSAPPAAPGPKKRGRKPKLKNIKKRMLEAQRAAQAAQQSAPGDHTDPPSPTTTTTTTTNNQQQQAQPQKTDIESPQSKRQTKKPRKYADEEDDLSQEKERTPNKVGRPKRVVSDDPMEDVSPEGEVEPNSAEKKSKKSKKTQPNNLDIRPCWYSTCSKADRSLKILRPCLIPTCKTHAIKSESRIYDVIGKGFCIEEKGNKDSVCGICGESGKALSHCANDECAFGYCDSCTAIVVGKHGNPPNGPKWVCWVCNAVKLRGKERERTRWVREIVQPNAYQLQPRKPRAPKVSQSNLAPTLSQAQLIQQQQLQLQGTQAPITLEDGSLAGPGRRKKKLITIPDYEMNYKKGRKRGFEEEPSAPPSPTNNNNNNNSNNNNNNITINEQDGSPDIFNYHSIMSPERDPISPVDFFIDQSFSSIKFFNSLLQNPPAEALDQFNNMVNTISRLRTIRWSNDYQMVWRAIEELAILFKRNLESSQTILSMQQELRAMDDSTIKMTNNNTRNQPLERAITRVFEHHQLSNQIEKESTSARNILLIAIDGAHRTIEEINQNFELDILRDKQKEDRLDQELVTIDDQLKSVNSEIHILKQQEAELMEQLSKVRGSLSQLEGLRDTFNKRISDIKIEGLLANNSISERELDCRTKRATLENEIGALNAMLSLMEGVYWGHEFFYSTEIGECEKAISSKVIDINQKIDLSRNDIPLAISLKPATIKELGQDTQSNVITVENQEEKLVSFLNPFKTLAIYHTACMDHNVPDFHLEKPDRIRVAINTINDFVAKYPSIVEVYNTPPEVELKYVMAVHDAHYIRKLETQLPPENSDMETHLESDNTGAMIAVTLKEGGEDDDIYDTFISHRSMKAAMRAAGSVCAAVDAVTKLGYHRTFCAIRPPGHHAGRFGRTSDAPSQGYCLINNVAIGAKYASLTAGYSRIAVVDFDVHHGNGTQEILSGDDNFLFISIHVCDKKSYFYPGTGRDVGEIHDDGSYEGNVLNIGLKRNSGSSAFIQQWVKKIIPRLEAYRPQLIFLSAGFDGHKDDPTNGLKLSEEDYYTVTKMIKAVAAKHSRGRIISVLEGGYGIEKGNSLQRCLNMHLKALVEDSNSEILYSQASSGDFGLIKKIYNGTTTNSTIREPNKKGDLENVALFNTIAKDYLDSIKQTPSAPVGTSTTNTTSAATSTATTEPIVLASPTQPNQHDKASAESSDKAFEIVKSSPTTSTNVINPKPPILPSIHSTEQLGSPKTSYQSSLTSPKSVVNNDNNTEGNTFLRPENGFTNNNQ